MAGRRIAWLGHRLRRRRVHRAAPARVAAAVAERRRPKRLAASRRLAPRRVRIAPAAAPVQTAGLSDFAARWMFGDGVADGVPFAGGAAVKYERPSFLGGPDGPAEPPQYHPPLAEPSPTATRLTAPVRGRVEEVGPRRPERFRLSRTPPPAPAPAPEEPQYHPPLGVAPAPAPAPPQPPSYHKPEHEERGAHPARQTVRPHPPAEEEQRPAVRVHHIHHEPEEEGGRGRRRDSRIGTGVRAARTAEVAYELHKGAGMVSELEKFGHTVADAARGEWSKLKKDAGEWKDRAEHEWNSLRRRGEREAHSLERRAMGEVHGLERQGRGLVRRAERLPGQLEHGLERGIERGLVGAERQALRDVGSFLRHQPLVRAATSLVRTGARDLAKVGDLEKGAVRIEKDLEKALKDPEKELLALGRKVEKEVMSRPIVKRAESALQHAERDVRHLPAEARHDISRGAAAAKAAALAAAADVPLEVSRAGRAVVQFEKQAAGAAHRLEADARHALADADGHMPHRLPHEPAGVSAIAKRAAEAPAAAAHAAQAASHDEMYEAVVDRLRRDLLAERERMGDLLGEWP